MDLEFLHLKSQNLDGQLSQHVSLSNYETFLFIYFLGISQDLIPKIINLEQHIHSLKEEMKEEMLVELLILFLKQEVFRLFYLLLFSHFR
jgi:hypothetical protein